MITTAQRSAAPSLFTLSANSKSVSAAEPSGKLSARVIDSQPEKAVPKKEVPTAVEFIQNIFSQTENGKHALKRKRVSYTPSDEAIDAYDTESLAAIRSRNVEKLRSLLNEGKSFNACNRFGESLIHMACRMGDVNVLKFLIEEAKVDVEVMDDFCRTVMHDACWTHTPNFAVMDTLLEHVPAYMLVAEDVRGHSPFHYARKEHWNEWKDYLEERLDLIQRRISLLQS